MSYRPLPGSLFGYFIFTYSRIVSLCVAVSFFFDLSLLPLSSSVVWAAATQIKSITPSCAAVGQRTSISGNGFGTTNLQILVGGVRASVTSATGTQATFVVPSGVTPGVVVVTATNPGGQSGSIALRIKNPVELCGDTVDDNCNGQIDDPDTCTPVNHPPVANAGPDQTQPVGTTVQLDGTGSSDPDGNTLTFTWSLTIKPGGSVTTPRQGADKSPARQQMVKVLTQRKNKKLYQQRSYTVEPLQGLLKDIFELDRCWRRGNANNRWVFAAMGVAVQMHQYRAWQEGRSV